MNTSEIHSHLKPLKKLISLREVAVILDRSESGLRWTLNNAELTDPILLAIKSAKIRIGRRVLYSSEIIDDAINKAIKTQNDAITLN